jgi:hypothetical protein
MRDLRWINQSTPERRSALLLDEGSQPVAFTLWQEVAAFAARLLLSINVIRNYVALHAVVCADYSRVERLVNLLLE